MFRFKLSPRRGHHVVGMLMAFVMAAVLAACGGGGGGSSSGCTTIDPNRDASLPGCPTTPVTPVTPVTPAGTLAMLLTDTNGAVTTTITPDHPGVLLVTLRSGANAAVVNTLVSYSSTDKSAGFIPASGGALTDASGVARITLPVGTVAGAFTATATATVDAKALSASVGYTVSLPASTPPGLTLSLADAIGNATVSVTPAQPGTLTASVRDEFGVAVASNVVSFATSDKTGGFVPASGTALTDARGVAQVTLPAGAVAGGYTVTATTTVHGKTISTGTSYAVTLPPLAPVTPAPLPTLALALSVASGASNSIAPDRPGSLLATVKDAAGNPVANALVSFATSDKTGALAPAAGTALTDAGGKASAQLLAGTSAGAYTVSASATVAAQALTAAANYAVTFPVLTLSAPALAPSNLAAGGTAALSVTVLSGGAAYAPALPVSFSSPCVVAGKARISSPVTTVNGVAGTSYADLGCGGADVITASTSYNGSSASSSATLTVQAVAAGQVVFVSALPQNIALKGTGGAGRQESATVTFKVLDRSGNPVSGQQVNFALNTSAGGLSLNPATGTTGATGLVTTAVSSGTVNTPVRVTASLPGTSLSTLSDQLVVSTGVPEQASFSLGTSVYNVEGGQFNGCPAPNGSMITARLADHFHNPAPDGTAVSFTAEGGSIDASCLTGLVSTTLTDGTLITQKGTPGECSVRYCAGNPRPADGRVTVLAYALGEESFVDANGNNLYNAGETFTDLGEPFRNDRAVTDANANSRDDSFSSGNAVRASGEMYIDSNGNGAWNQTGDGAYNGVLQAVPNVNSSAANTVHIRQSLVMVLSNSEAAVTWLNGASATTRGPLALSHCVTGTAFINTARTFSFAIRDSNPTVFATNTAARRGLPFDLPGNPLPAGSRITFSSSNGLVLGTKVYTVPNTNNADASAWTYGVSLISDASQDALGLQCTDATGTSGSLSIDILTPANVQYHSEFQITD